DSNSASKVLATRDRHEYETETCPDLRSIAKDLPPSSQTESAKTVIDRAMVPQRGFTRIFCPSSRTTTTPSNPLCADEDEDEEEESTSESPEGSGAAGAEGGGSEAVADGADEKAEMSSTGNLE
ncbi:hypothetical protein AK812_SmicGene47760, partial [Symbiodinium microadriaticum]